MVLFLTGGKLRQSFFFHFDGKSRNGGCLVTALLQDTGGDKMFMQVIHVFNQAILQGPRNANVVKHGKVLDVFAKSDTACVGTDRDAKFFGHQDNSQDLTIVSQQKNQYHFPG